MTIDKLLSDLIIYAEKEVAENEAIERLRVKAEGIGAIKYDKDKVATTPAHDRLEQDVIKLHEAQERVAKIRRKRLEDRAVATTLFTKNLDKDEALIMIMFYVMGMSVPAIEKQTGYKRQWVYNKRNSGLDKLKRI